MLFSKQSAYRFGRSRRSPGGASYCAFHRSGGEACGHSSNVRNDVRVRSRAFNRERDAARATARGCPLAQAAYDTPARACHLAYAAYHAPAQIRQHLEVECPPWAYGTASCNHADCRDVEVDIVSLCTGGRDIRIEAQIANRRVGL